MVEPEYYSKNGLSPLKAFAKGLLSKEQYIGFCKGNVIKYVVRAGEKTDDATSDIMKAIDYLNALDSALSDNSTLSDDIHIDFDVNMDINDFKDTMNVKIDELKESISEFKKNL